MTKGGNNLVEGQRIGEFLNEMIKEEEISDKKKEKMYKKIKVKKRKTDVIKWRETLYIIIIFMLLMTVPYMKKKIETNDEEKKEGIEQIYDKIEKTNQP